jgi:3-hydroxyisobutyrate dehydrogenase-like beta-hydroxyacid dehydrogenase
MSPAMSTTQVDHRPSSGANGARQIAVLGSGRMGSAIADRLADGGFELILWDRTRDRASALGVGMVADTPAAAVRDADVVISSLSAGAVRSTYLELGGAVNACAGKLFIEMSATDPDLLPSLAADVHAAGGGLLDAQIVGSPAAMRTGQTMILVGGDYRDARLADPVLSAMGTVRHVGPVGSGARLKLVADSMLADIVLAAAELQVAGEHAGLKPDDIFWVLERMAPVLAARRNGIVENRHEPTLLALRDLRDALDVALELFEPPEIRTPLTLQARHLVAAAARRFGELDITAVERPYRQVEPTNDADTRTPASWATLAT